MPYLGQKLDVIGRKRVLDDILERELIAGVYDHDKPQLPSKGRSQFSPARRRLV